MARIEAVPAAKAGPLTRILYWLMPRGMKKLTGRDFDERQLVAITALLTLVDPHRFNAAFGIGPAGFSDGMVCVPPDRPAQAAALRATVP